MNDDIKRPDPDMLLARIKSEEQNENRGRLKIFLGYVAGVGKTYAMLETAHQRKDEGLDVVVAYVETHDRKETEAQLEGLEVIPRRQVEYHGTILPEMNLDAVLARHPQLALVDELAHTNAPGSRHPKRYQDVEELLNAGIDIYTTINIQHLESLIDVVHQITGVTVSETVPDSLIDDAYEIELVDLPTDELLQRLRSGKVYVPDQAARALEKFFRKGNLTALRELSLRRAANRVDDQMVDYMQTRAIPGPWPARERIMVCISSHPLGERLIRTGRRLADDLKADWYVVFVETPGHLNMPEENHLRIQRYLLLATELGARVVNLPGRLVSDSVLEYAHDHNITKIVVGKPLRSRWYDFIQGSMIDQIIRKSGKIDVYVVSEGIETTQKISVKSVKPTYRFRSYLLSVGLIALATLISLPLRNIFDPTNLVMLYLASVVISAVYLGRGPAILASLLSVVLFDFFMTEPRYSLAVKDTQYILTFIGLLLVGLIISNLASVMGKQLEALRSRNRQSQAVNNLSRELNSAVGSNEIFKTVVHHVSQFFDREVVIFLPEAQKLVMMASSTGYVMGINDIAVAEWCFKNGKAAGHGTDTLPAAPVHFIPLKTVQGTIGVLGLRPFDPADHLSLEQRALLEGFANISALAIERVSFAEQASHSEMLRRTEKLQSALLNSISQELRTPLAEITRALTWLQESNSPSYPTAKLDAQTGLELIDLAADRARQLNRLVENLLDMTRVEAGTLRVHPELVDFFDLTRKVIDQMSDRLHNHPIRFDFPEDLEPVAVDKLLISQVLTNLLDNASKYSADGTPIEIIARSSKQQGSTGNASFTVFIKDYGYGIPQGDLGRVFDKFYRSQHPGQVVGTGLGLSICKGIVEAHGGQISIRNNPDRGVTVFFTLPGSKT